MISMISFIFQADYCGIIRCQINANTARHTSCIIYGLNEIHRQYIYSFKGIFFAAYEGKYSFGSVNILRAGPVKGISQAAPP